MRFGLVAGLLAATVVVAMLLIPAKPPSLALLTGPTPRPFTASRCFELTYSDPVRVERLPHTLRLFPDTAFWSLARPMYRAAADGDPSWRESWWTYAGQDSIDVTAHHQPLLRLPRDVAGPGRGVPYVDGTLLPALLSGAYARFVVTSVEVSCNRKDHGAA